MISVLLNVAPDGGQESRLQAAISLVKRHGGHITCVQTLGVLPVAPDPTAATTEAEGVIDVEEIGREFQKTVEAGLDGQGVVDGRQGGVWMGRGEDEDLQRLGGGLSQRH